MSEEDASIRTNIWPAHHLHYLLIQNLIYLTSMSMNIFLCKEAVNIELSQEGIPSDFLDDIPIGNLLEDVDTTKKRDYFMNPISILCILRKSLVVHQKWVTVKGKVVEKDKLGYSMPFA